MGFGNSNATETFNIPQSGGGDFEKPPLGPQPGMVTGVYYLGNIMIKSTYGDGYKPRLMLQITLEARGQDGGNFVIYEEYTASCYGSAILGVFLSGLSGSKVDENFSSYPKALWTCGTFNMGEDNTGKFVNIINAMPYMNPLNMDVTGIMNDQSVTRLFDVGITDLNSFRLLPRRAQKRAMKSEEFAANYASLVQQQDPQLWDTLIGGGEDRKPQQQQAQQQGFGHQQQQQAPQQGYQQQQAPQQGYQQQQAPQQGYQQQQAPAQQQQGVANRTMAGQPVGNHPDAPQNMRQAGMQQATGQQPAQHNQNMAQPNTQQQHVQQQQANNQQFQNPAGQTVQQTMQSQQPMQGQVMSQQNQGQQQNVNAAGAIDEFEDEIPF